MKSTLLSGICLLASLLVGDNDSSADSLTVTQTQNGATAALAMGETLSVVLGGNPTTGYQWTVVENDTSRLQPLGPFYEADSDAIGSGGIYTFRFRALRAGTSLLRMAYRRARESAPAQTYSLTVTVREDGDAAATVSLDDTQAESLYHSLLAQSRRWSIPNAQLTLANAADQPLIVFDPR